jgi:hypothetical protein
VEVVELRLVRPPVALFGLVLMLVDQLAEVDPEVVLVALEVVLVEEEAALVDLEACFDPVEEGSLEDGRGQCQVGSVQRVGKVQSSQIGIQEDSQAPQ